MLLDNEASICLFHNRALLCNIRRVSQTVTIGGVGGEVLTTNMVGDFTLLGITVWFHPKAVANILSFTMIESMYDITYHRLREFTVHVNDKVNLSFKRMIIDEESCGGLFVCDMKQYAEKQHVVNVSTVQYNESLFTKREVEEAKRAKEFIRMLGYPSD